MPRRKANTEYIPREEQEFRKIVEKFIAKNPLPREWGPNDTWRFSAAVALVKVACHPHLVNPRPDSGRDGPGEELPIQIEFCQRFAEHPQYFIKLLEHARRKGGVRNQDRAISFLRDGTFQRKYQAKYGRDPTDGEVAGEIMKLHNLENYNDLWVGRARKQMVKDDKKLKAARKQRFLDLISPEKPL